MSPQAKKLAVTMAEKVVEAAFADAGDNDYVTLFEPQEMMRYDLYRMWGLTPGQIANLSGHGPEAMLYFESLVFAANGGEPWVTQGQFDRYQKTRAMA